MAADDRPDPTTAQEHTMDSSSPGTPHDAPEGTDAGTSRETRPDDTAPWSVADLAGESDRSTPPAPGGSTAGTSQQRGVRVGTVVWGLVVAAVGVGLAALAAGVVFDVQLAFIAIVALAGVGLVAGSVASAGRRRSGAART